MKLKSIKFNSIIFLTFFSFSIIISSCAPTRVVRTLKQGEKRLGGNIGGPLINYNGTVIPVPFTSVYYAQGISDTITVFGGIHTTSALFGNFQTEIGGTYDIWRNKDTTKGVTGTFALNTAFNINNKESLQDVQNKPRTLNSFRLWPQIDANAYYVYNKSKNHFLYYGISTWIETKSNRQSGQKQSAYVFVSPHVGTTLSNNLLNFTFELKYLAPYMNSWDPLVDYIRPVGRYGGLGFHIAVTKKLIKKEYIEEEIVE
jgi:hypothetical protein